MCNQWRRFTKAYRCMSGSAPDTLSFSKSNYLAEMYRKVHQLRNTERWQGNSEEMEICLYINAHFFIIVNRAAVRLAAQGSVSRQYNSETQRSLAVISSRSWPPMCQSLRMQLLAPPRAAEQNVPSSILMGVLGGVRAAPDSGGLFSFSGLPSSEGSAGAGKGN